MVIIIIAGGSGTRLWPLSTPDYPKHLLTINNDDRSLLQHTYDRARKMTEAIYVVSDESHIEHVKHQLPELPVEGFIIEPARRGTANCLMAAMAYVGQRHGPEEVIVSLHADHYVRDTEGFVHSFKIATEVSRHNNRIVLVGAEPAYPATGFGYIQKGGLFDENSYVYDVASFKEKPDFESAKDYFDSGNYLWNCGYFVGSINTFKEKMRAYAPTLLSIFERLQSMSSLEEYKDYYLGLDNDAIDYALIEKVKDLLVVPATFDWMDLGSYSDMHKAVGGDEQGNHVHGLVNIEDVSNSFIQNYEDKPVAVIGLDGVVVINTSRGILVVPKDLAQKVGDISKRL